MFSALNLTNDTTHCGNLGHGTDDPFAICDMADAHGFASVNLDLTAAAEWDPTALKTRLAASGLRIAAVGFTADIFGSEDAFTKSVVAFEAEARLAQALGCHAALCYIPPFSDDLPFGARFTQTARRLRACRPILDACDLTVGFEFIGPTETRRESRYDFIHTMDGVRALVAAGGLEGRGGFKLDVHHWQTSGAGPLDLHHLAPHEIVYVELNDGLPGHDRFTMPEFERELPLATSVTDIRGFMKALAAIGYAGPVAVEPWNARIRAMPRKAAVAEVKAALDACLALIA